MEYSGAGENDIGIRNLKIITHDINKVEKLIKNFEENLQK